ITAALERRPGGDMQIGSHLPGDDSGQGGLAETGWSGEEEVVGGLAPPTGRLEDDLEMLLEFGLTHEVVEGAWSQTRFLVEFDRFDRFGVEEFIAGHQRVPPSRRSASRSIWSTSSSARS